MQEKLGTGRRKTAVAAVRLRSGTGKVLVNGKNFEDYFTLPLQRQAILSPLSTVGDAKQYDLIIRVRGGGVEGQVIAARLGIARALVGGDETIRPLLKEHGYLTRDSRRRERKKYGRAGARKRFQFSKR